MNNQEFQVVLQSLPVGFDIVVNGSSHFDVKGYFEIKEGCTKGVIHITDISPSKFLKNKETQPDLSEEEKRVRRNNQLIGARMRYAEKKKKEKLAAAVPQGSLTGKKLYKIYSPGEKEEMIRDINAGISFSEINKKYGISRNTYGRFKKQKSAAEGVKIDDETQEKIKADVKLGLFTPQILKKYHINVPTLAAIKKSIKAENSALGDTGPEDDLKALKKRLDYGRSINNGSDSSPTTGMLKGITSGASIPDGSAVSVDLNKLQEKAAKEEAVRKIRPSARVGVRKWQQQALARGL